MGTASNGEGAISSTTPVDLPNAPFSKGSIGSRPIEFAVVGYGNWGSKHTRVLAHTPDVAVTVVDRDPRRLAEARRAFPMVKVSDSLDATLGGVDAVIIATPPRSHAPIAHAAIRAGCNVLVEKPLATTVAECEQLIDAAVMNNVLLFVGHTFEHDAAILEIARHREQRAAR